MKRLILLLILFVNLQIVITHEEMKLFSYLTASAQHMTKEGNDKLLPGRIRVVLLSRP